ncbi:MAG TPA: hypothetical protein VHO70_21405, partial [Chitinispirillaceae bacterium]|nr:hypothetical protein [Chitinispirillaceae bacterium]
MEVKGIAVIPMKDYVHNNFSSQFQEWFDSLSKESQEIMWNPLPGIWYPLQTAIVEPTQKICNL